MKYAVMVEKVSGVAEPEGLYPASVPSLCLVTHGENVESALEAARDLVGRWLEELRERDLPGDPEAGGHERGGIS